MLADKHGTAAIDALVADGFDKPSDFVSPKSQGSTVSAEEFNAINEAIVLGFSADIQRLLAKPVKSLTDAQKTTRRYWQQQIGAKRNEFKRALAKRENAETSGNTSRTRTPQQRVTDNLNDSIKVLQEADGVPFDTVKVLELCKKALAEATKIAH